MIYYIMEPVYLLLVCICLFRSPSIGKFLHEFKVSLNSILALYFEKYFSENIFRVSSNIYDEFFADL